MRSLIHLCVPLLLSSLTAAQLTVVAIDPPLNGSNGAPNASIVVDFDRALDAASLDALRVYGSASGPAQGSKTLENGGARLRFQPLEPFLAGEIVWTLMSENLKAQDGSFLRTEGYAASFRVRAAPAPRAFTLIQSWDVDPNIFARIYGGQNCDLDDDGFIDVSVICENSSDVRVYLSNDDGKGTYAGVQSPLNPVGTTPSPNESADFNGDGNIDIATSNSGFGSVSVLLGNGDGTFGAATNHSLGNPSYGLAVLDVDGDGDMDIAAPANDQVRLLLNLGNGTFAAPIAIATAVQNDYGLTAADMNNDGIVDLVVGSVTAQIMVLLSNGNATFTPMPVQNAGGHAWMIVCGDVNGDGNMDATVANGGNGRGSRLLGNGNGTLQAPFSTPQIGWMTATDLGDLDGDGDLDWVLSSFGAGVYQMYVNNGAGGFTLDQTIPALQNPACCAIFDADGDRDLDLALFDETADIVRIMENGSLDQETYCYGTAAACPCGNVGADGHGCENSAQSGGALVLGQGQASVSSDSLALHAGGMPASTTLVFLQGQDQAGGGLGTPFGDGLLCVSGTLVRLASKTSVNGFASLGAGNLGDPPISQLGTIPVVGGTFTYQVWFRNTDNYCTSSTFNLSNGLKLVWTP